MIVGILEKLLEGSRDKEGIGELMTGTAFRTDVTDALYKGLSQGISQGIKSLVTTVRDLGSTKEKAVESIVREYGKDEVEAKELVEKYW